MEALYQGRVRVSMGERKRLWKDWGFPFLCVFPSHLPQDRGLLLPPPVLPTATTSSPPPYHHHYSHSRLTMSATDERLLAAITRAMQGPDPEGEEPHRSPSPDQSEGEDEGEKMRRTDSTSQSPSFGPSDRPGPKTGPKGVLADYRHSTQSLEEETEEDKAFLEAYRAKRLQELQKPR